ncbi:MAG: MFS transporter, partial [Bacillota bacterium]
MQSQKLRLYLYTAAICSTALLGCMANNIVGPLLGDIMRQYAISLDRGGMMSLYQNIGGVLSILLLAIVMDRLNKPFAMFAPFILLPACLLLIGATPPYAVFMLLYLLFGISLSTMDMIGNAIIPEIHPEKRDAALSLLHGSAPVGALIVPLFAGALLDAGTPWQTAYTIIGIISVLLLLFYAVTFAMA